MLVHHVLVALFLTLFLAPPVWSALTPVIQEFGNISISVDAEGNNDPAGGTISVEKPPGATVRSAFLMATSAFFAVIADGGISLAGTPVSWDRTVFNNAGASLTFFHNVFADVTSIVKPIIDAAPAGINELQVTEVNTIFINGTVLAVIFDDPNQITDNGLILLFGGQDTLGDSFIVELAGPLDLTDPSTVVDMGLGISHGFQGIFGTPMVNLIDVNGERLTSSAGGEDDGLSANGGLITVGGIGDSNANPPPFAPSSGFDTDDELYDLLPFVTTGDTSILVESINPTDDDDVFFAYFVTSVPSAILPEVPPPGARSIVTDDVIGFIDPDKPTIVLTHGLQNKDSEPGELWTGFGDDNNAGTLIRTLLGNSVNILQFLWEEANQVDNVPVPGPNGAEYIAARQNVSDASATLAKFLSEELGPEYSQSIHFIGHSLGTAVNAYHRARSGTIGSDRS